MDAFSGMSELIADLQKLGPSVEREAAAILLKHATSASNSIVSSYPAKTGRLRRGVAVKQKTALRYQLRTRAHHAHLWELGTTNRSGPPNRGVMPKGNVFIPTVVRWREQMTHQLIGLVRRSKVRHMDGALEVVAHGH